MIFDVLARPDRFFPVHICGVPTTITNGKATVWLCKTRLSIGFKPIICGEYLWSILIIVKTKIANGKLATAVSGVLSANENGSQITCYAANGDWLFIT